MDIQGLHIITLMHLFLRIAMAHSYSKAVTLDRSLAVLSYIFIHRSFVSLLFTLFNQYEIQACIRMPECCVNSSDF